jgi:hypothetical protein
MNVTFFKVIEVVVHDVPQQSDTAPLTLTDGPITLDQQLRDYFRRKIISSLKLRGLDIVADTTADATVREGIARTLQDPTELVTASKAIAQHLYDSQTDRNPAGLLAVIHGSLGVKPCMAIVKLEREQGVRVQLNVVQGKTLIDMQYLRDLTLTEKTRIFKTTILETNSQFEPESLSGRASDDQRGMEDGHLGVAAFFLRTFLGCRLRDNPEKTTADFFEGSVDHFNAAITDPNKRARYSVALLSAMEAQAIDIRPRSFADAHLDEADRPGYLSSLKEQKGLDPEVTFQKDTTRIEKHVSGFKMVFESGMTLIGRQDDLKERVHVRPQTADPPGAEVNDTIKRLSGR